MAVLTLGSDGQPKKPDEGLGKIVRDIPPVIAMKGSSIFCTWMDRLFGSEVARAAQPHFLTAGKLLAVPGCINKATEFPSKVKDFNRDRDVKTGTALGSNVATVVSKGAESVDVLGRCNVLPVQTAWWGGLSQTASLVGDFCDLGNMAATGKPEPYAGESDSRSKDLANKEQNNFWAKLIKNVLAVAYHAIGALTFLFGVIWASTTALYAGTALMIATLAHHFIEGDMKQRRNMDAYEAHQRGLQTA